MQQKLIFAVGALFLGTAAIDKPDDRAILHKRFEGLMAAARAGQDVPTYDNLETVAGVAAPVPLPRAAAPELQDALSAAADYAGNRNSKALLVYYRGKLVLERYFGATTATTPIVAKSLAKPMTAIAVGRAIKLGKIATLDTPVARWVTEWQGDPRKAQMRVRHLLDMRSGMLAQGFSPDPDNVMNRAYLDPRHDEVIIADYPLTNAPGTRYDYANATAEMVAPLIERATGLRYAAFLSKQLLQPIGAAGGTVWVNRQGGTAHSGCCLLLPAESWLRLALLVMNDGKVSGRQILPTGYVTQMRTGTVENPRYGLGIWLQGNYVERRSFDNPDRGTKGVLQSAPFKAQDVMMFDGNGSQVAYLIPSRDLVIMRLGDTPPKSLEWDNAYLPNLLTEAIDRQPVRR
jgi:CubicO group peptidase (beta-lactamase class C family)